MKAENIVAIAIVLIAFGWVLRSVLRSSKNGRSGCGTGCGSCGMANELLKAADDDGESGAERTDRNS